jgi:hypothetical protein
MRSVLHSTDHHRAENVSFSMTSSNKRANMSAPKVHLKVFIIQKNFESSEKEFSDSM